MKTNRPVIFIELNEFNRDLLVDCSEKFNLKSLSRVLKFKETTTFSRDTYESDFLEPWSQWVSVHTGKPSSDHLIKHLDDVSSLKLPQIWQSLGNKGFSTGVWGAINGSRAGATNCKFFVPDPWTFSEDAYPKSLSYLVDLPRYIVKNRTHIKWPKLLSLGVSFLQIFLNIDVLIEAFLNTPRVLGRVFKDGLKEYVSFSFFEYLSTLEFLRVWKRERPDVSFLFLNLVAHVQHYYWNMESEGNRERFRYCLSFLDLVLERLLRSDAELIVYNGLSQMCTIEEKPWISYRPIDHDHFLQFFDIKYSRVEPLMSYDAILLFESKGDAQEAFKQLRDITVEGKQLLLVENYREDENRLFYRMSFTDELQPNALLKSPTKEVAFDSLVTKIVTRTGKHIPIGNIFSSWPIFPNKTENINVMSILEENLMNRVKTV